MGRKHAQKGQIVLKKEEKIAAVAAALPAGFSGKDFVAKFKEMYPKDWERIVRRYEEHEERTRAGKRHPMPEPTTYVLNMSKKLKNKGV